MIRTTDAMIKAVNVQKAKERLASNRDALARAEAAGATEYVVLFKDWIATGEREVADAMEMLRNPAA
jgi:hypothetical protein